MSLKMKRAVTVIFTVIMVSMLLTIPANAEGPLKSQSSNRFDTAISHSGTVATVSANVKSASSINKTTIKMELQKKNGSSYSTVKTWTSTVNASSASMRKTAVVSSKATYRVKTTFTLYSSNGKETITKIAY